MNNFKSDYIMSYVASNVSIRNAIQSNIEDMHILNVITSIASSVYAENKHS